MRRLYKSTRDTKFLGVCGGIAEYFDVDPTLIRVLLLISIPMGGLGILSYMILAFILPTDYSVERSNRRSQSAEYEHRKANQAKRDVVNHDDGWGDF